MSEIPLMVQKREFSGRFVFASEWCYWSCIGDELFSIWQWRLYKRGVVLWNGTFETCAVEA